MQKKGRLIVLEAGDGSGKKTQTELLYKHLLAEGRQVRRVEFPDYNSHSSALIKMYLRGEFGSSPDSVNPYVASLFYAVDRFASFRCNWQNYYNKGGIIIADRYVTSNMVHQASKLIHENERKEFIAWLNDIEYDKCRIPRPDAVIFLNVPVDLTYKLMADRTLRDINRQCDIHERDQSYLYKCHTAGIWLAEYLNWKIIDCVCNGELRTADDISHEIYQHLISVNILQ